MERIEDIMDSAVFYCTKGTALKTVAKILRDHHCGNMPVVADHSKSVVGIISTKDICYRSLGRGLNPMDLTAEDCMTSPAITVSHKISLPYCYELMEKYKIGMLPVVDDNENLCGIIYRQALISYLGRFQETSRSPNL